MSSLSSVPVYVAVFVNALQSSLLYVGVCIMGLLVLPVYLGDGCLAMDFCLLYVGVYVAGVCSRLMQCQFSIFDERSGTSQTKNALLTRWSWLLVLAGCHRVVSYIHLTLFKRQTPFDLPSGEREIESFLITFSRKSNIVPVTVVTLVLQLPQVLLT